MRPEFVELIDRIFSDGIWVNPETKQPYILMKGDMAIKPDEIILIARALQVLFPQPEEKL